MALARADQRPARVIKVKQKASTRKAQAVEREVASGMAAYRDHRLPEAERSARDVLSRHPDHTPALALLGATLLANGRPQEALAPLEQAVRQSADAISETHLAIALKAIGRGTEGLTLLERAVTRVPPYAPAFLEFGMLLYDQRRLAEAEKVLAQGAGLAPSIADFFIGLGGIAMDRGDAAGAQRRFARALAIAPGHPGAMHGFGSALMGDADFERAAQKFRQIIADNPSDHRASILLGCCLLELGKFEQATELLRGVAHSAPQLYDKILRAFTEAGRGRLWIKPSAAAAVLRPRNYSGT
jgi:Tfp pilus assembly protein PilF